MKNLIRKLRRLAGVRGATMAEYAILMAVIALIVVTAARALGNSVSSSLNRAATSIGAAGVGGGTTTSGNTTSGNTTSGNTTSGNTTSGNTTSGNTTRGNTTRGNNNE